MRKITLMLLTLFMIVFAGQPVSAQVDTSRVLTSMQRYFNFISMGQYASAYNYIRTGQTMYDYVAGFENTDWIQPYLGIPQSNGTDIRVPVTLVSFQRDYSTQTFFGCIFLQDEGSIYGIIGNNLVDLGFIAEPAVFSVVDSLNNLNCYDATGVSPIPVESNRGPGEAGGLLRQYFDSVTSRNYDAAYGMWLYPLPFADPDGAPSVDYRPIISTFIEGYLETRHVVVYSGSLNQYQHSGATAGRPYLDGMQPVVLVDQLSTGDIATYSGCFAMGRFTDNRMGIINANLTVLTNGAPTANQIQEALLVNCTDLGISV